jgi:hypothetical protein
MRQIVQIGNNWKNPAWQAKLSRRPHRGNLASSTAGNVVSKQRPDQTALSVAQTASDFPWNRLASPVFCGPVGIGIAVVMRRFDMETAVLAAITSAVGNPRFWNMKIKIAILAAATFAAMC